MDFINEEYYAPYLDVQIRYERVVKKYGYNDEETEYYPIMEDGTVVVRKIIVQGINIIGANQGTIDSYGRERIPCIYDFCEPINSEMYIVGKNYVSDFYSDDDFYLTKKMYGIVDADGKILTPISYKMISINDNKVILQDFDNKEISVGINDSKQKTIVKK